MQQFLFRITIIELAQSGRSSFYRNFLLYLYFIHLQKERSNDQNETADHMAESWEAHRLAAGGAKAQGLTEMEPCGPQACPGCGQPSVAVCFAEEVDSGNT